MVRAEGCGGLWVGTKQVLGLGFRAYCTVTMPGIVSDFYWCSSAPTPPGTKNIRMMSTNRQRTIAENMPRVECGV